MKPFTEAARYEYALTPESVVVDVGAHLGGFSRIIAARYGCRVVAFEPVTDFYNAAWAVLANFPKVELINAGVAGHASIHDVAVKGDSSGIFADSDTKVAATFMSISSVPDADLLKLNCEGGEYEILERLLETNTATRFKNIAVQFHTVVPDSEKRYRAIQEGLRKTHHPTWDSSFVWENWERNE